jgi:hypothetical protein
MQCVVKIPELNTIFFVAELRKIPEARDGVEIVPEAWVEVPRDIADWPIGTDRPPPRTLGICKTNPKHYREFKYPDEVEKAGFEPTGMNYGGAYSPSQWEQLAKRIPAMKAFEAITGNDRPGAMDDAMRYIREAR